MEIERYEEITVDLKGLTVAEFEYLQKALSYHSRNVLDITCTEDKELIEFNSKIQDYNVKVGF